MGYYATGHGSIKIVGDNIAEAYNAMVQLNAYDHLKSGGTYGGGKEISRHFSWMPTDLSTIPTCAEMLQALGFEVIVDGADGVIEATGYNSKVGDEQVFLTAIAPWVEDESYFEWVGEDGDQWRWAFVKGEMFVQNGYISWAEPQKATLLEADNAAR
ncbi:MAG: hypothetical protein EBS90_07055 [Betaproteobacteria bacterium]|nr:hypothetical protein [Betaproteobacteria bacterium]